MESVSNSNDYESIARAICDQTNIEHTQFNLDKVLQVIDKIEAFTGCKLYNKDQLTNQLVEMSEENFSSEAKKAIWKNMIPQVNFNTLFKSDMDFTLVFKEDDVIVLYKNKIIKTDNFEQIKSNLLRNHTKDFPPISEMYVDNICQVISKFMSKDITVQYYCSNIPAPYWKLFEIKCKKSNANSKEIYDKCQELEKIVTGQYFQSVKPDNVQVIGQAPSADDDELKAVLMQIEEYENKNKNNSSVSSSGPDLTKLSDNETKALDDIYRMEVMSYLNDNEIMEYLDVLEKVDGLDKESKHTEKEYITKYFKLLIDSTGSMKNKIAKFYYVYKLYALINKATWFIEQYEGMRKNVAAKINEFTDELYILQSAELKLYHGVVSTMEKTKELIDSIEKKSNPNYVSKWQTNNQQVILNQIITNANTSANNGTNTNQIVLESDDEMEDEDNNSDYDSDN